MNNQIVKNVLFYGTFGSFGLYTFYEVAKSEFNKKEKSNFYFHRVLTQYKYLEDCNFNQLNTYKNPFIKDNDEESIIKSIHPKYIIYHPSCTIFYNDFKNSYHTYKSYKYDYKHNYGI